MASTGPAVGSRPLDPYKRLETVEDFKQLIDGVDHVLLDCDGVIWLEDELIGHARLAIEYFRKHRIGVAFVSNNATATRKAYQEKFKKLGIDVHVDHVYTSGSASAFYLRETLLPSLPEHQRHVYVIGQSALEEELAALGLTWHGGTDPEDLRPMPPQDFSDITPKPEIGVVLASFDMHYNYKKMSKAFNYLSHNDGCVLLLSNDDVQVPLHGGSTAAGEGAIAASLKLAAKSDIVVAGKPNQPLLDTVLQRMEFDRSRTLMIGDRLETDITFGNNGNIKTLLVLSGSSKEEDIHKTGVRPHYVCESLGQIADMLEQAHKEIYPENDSHPMNQTA